MAEEQKPTAADAPAEGTAPAESADGAKKGLLGNKLVLIGIAVFVVLAIGGIAAYFMLGKAPAEEEVAIDPASAVVMFDVPPITTNLLTNGGPSRFLKVKLALELGGEKDKAEVEKMLPRLQDDWQNFLRQMRAEDTEGSASMQRLKEALMLRANQVLAPVVVRNVLFRELLVQ